VYLLCDVLVEMLILCAAKFFIVANRLLTIARCYHTTKCWYAVDKQLLSKLRKSTGFSFVNCREALEKYDNDLKQVCDIC
jgi:hypothetical protein